MQPPEPGGQGLHRTTAGRGGTKWGCVLLRSPLAICGPQPYAVARGASRRPQSPRTPPSCKPPSGRRAKASSRRTVPVNQRTGSGEVEVRSTARVRHFVHERHCRARQLQPVRVHGCCKQRLPLVVDDISAGEKAAIGGILDHRSELAAIRGKDPERALPARARGCEQNALAAWKRLRPAMDQYARRVLSGVRQRLRHPTRGGYAEKPSGLVQRRNDCIVSTPRSAARARGIAKGNWSAAIHGNFLQLASAEEGDPLPVRRKKRKERALGASEGSSLCLVEAPDG